MKEKRKGKFIPFASYLRPTEELLWQTPEHLTSVLPTVSFSIFRAVALVLYVFGAIALVTGRQFEGVWIILVFIVLPFISLFFLHLLLEGRIFKITLPDRTRYAITSERLIYERGNDLQAKPLDDISVIDVLPDNTLSFGAVFPQWAGLEDAEHIKFIIERAQKERLKAVSMSDADEYSLEQEQRYKNSVLK